MTPYELSLLIHFRCMAKEFENNDTNLYREVVEQFIFTGIIEISSWSGSGFRLTKKGDCWLECILNTPMPKQAWIDSNNEVISC